MCRSKAQGGRRCPSSQKKSIGASAPTTTQEKAVPEWAESHFKRISSESNSLGLTVTRYEGNLADSGYFAPVQVSGKIDPKSLTEDSYKDFGFTHPDDGKAKSLPLPTYVALSAMETESNPEMSKEEIQRSIKEYTHDGYQGLNYHMQRGEVLSSKEELLASHLSSAIQSHDAPQRHVYRGLSFEDFDAGDEYADNFELGQEVVFDTFQSTSAFPQTAANFAALNGPAENGVILEIMTPKGLPVASFAAFKDEGEVLLAPQSRYMVVGKHEHEDSESYGTTSQKVIQLVAIDEEGNVLV